MVAATPGPDDITLVINGQKLSGWQVMSCTLGIEICPSSFSLQMTELFPGQLSKLTVQPGDTCQVLLGTDPVITGYVDRMIPSIEDRDHTIQILGRSKSADFVDCSAEWPGGQIIGSSAFEITKKLAAPYGITVNAAVDTGAVIPQFNLTIGESAYAIAERVARYRGLLIYDLPDGSITLAQAGNGKMSSGIMEGDGGNLQRGTATYSADERYSTYDVFLQSLDILTDLGDGGNLKASITDTGVKRHRQLDIIAEAGGQGLDVAIQRGKWEAARRAGRANRIDAHLDSWRDSAGKLWTPNFLIPVVSPNLKAPAYDWLIGQVTFLKDRTGTHADLIVMPKQAFLPEPILLQPFPPDVAPQ